MANQIQSVKEKPKKRPAKKPLQLIQINDADDVINYLELPTQRKSKRVAKQDRKK